MWLFTELVGRAFGAVFRRVSAHALVALWSAAKTIAMQFVVALIMETITMATYRPATTEVVVAR